MQMLQTLTPLFIFAVFLPLLPSRANQVNGSNCIIEGVGSELRATKTQDGVVKEEDLIVPGKSIGKLSLGMTQPEVYNLMKGANPTETMDYDDGSRLYKWGNTYSVIINVKSERVTYVGTGDARFATKEGVHVGDSQFTLEVKMGTPQRRERFPGEGNVPWAFWYGRRSTRFLIQGGKITTIEVWVSDK